MITPTLTPIALERTATNTFRGYNHNLQTGNGEWYDTKNLTTSYAPLLSPRRKRGEVMTMTSPGGIIEKDALYYIDGGTLYNNGLATGLTNISPGLKQLISFGAYILIWPDKLYYNTADPADYGSIEAHFVNTGSIDYQMSHVDGTPYQSYYAGDKEPDTNVEIWIQSTAGTTDVVVKQKTSEGWVVLNTVYTRINFSTEGVIPALFKDMDAVTFSDSSLDGMNGTKLVYAVGGGKELPDGTIEKDYMVVINQLDAEHEMWETEPLVIDRTVPDLDFICECDNRLWGCYYGFNGTQTLNEIYCCALGDFKNWNRFAGVSTDSWVGSCGTDGEWTGCINYLGSPTFFKENHIHKVTISPYGAHRLSETPCRGVQKGSHRSLKIVNETLYYKSRVDICAYQGSFPASISDALGGLTYYDAVAGTFGEKYYISMRDAAGDWKLFTFDTANKLWMKEDELHAVDFAKVDDELFAVTANNKLVALNGTAGALEERIEWSCETGLEHYNVADHKYLSRYDIRLRGEKGGKIEVYMEYDSDGVWRHSGTIRQVRPDTVTLPIRPRRCDHLRMKLVGIGDFKIYSITRVLEVGSDV